MALRTIMCKSYSTMSLTRTDRNESDEEIVKCTSSVSSDKACSEFWEMMQHCERVAFPKIEPNSCPTSREAHLYWHLYTAAAKHSYLYRKQMNQALMTTLVKINRSKVKRSNISISAELLHLDSLDYLSRKRIINQLEQFIRSQDALESISLENLSLTGNEGLRLILALYNSRKAIKYLHCWRAFKRTNGSQLLDASPVSETVRYEDRKIRKCDWFRAIGCLECLTTLSINYAYVATPTGDLLINIAKRLGSNWQWLQLLCSNDDFVGNRLGSAIADVIIPQEAWDEIKFWSANLKVQYTIIGVPEYYRHKRFFSRSTPIHTFILSTEFILKSRPRWYLDCTMKTLYAWFPATLVHLYLRLWHQREDMDSHLSKVLLCLPRLQIFEFHGEIRKLKTLCSMCCQIRTRECSIRRVNLQLQSIVHDGTKDVKFIKCVKTLLLCFSEAFDEMGIKFNVNFLESWK